jgi:glycolate oxidase FAD binding subunit
MSIPHELAAACADVRLATTADVIAGRQARWVAAPGTTREAAAVLQTAAVLGLSVVPRGAGRLQHWGDPPDSCDLIIDTRRLNRIIEHLPGDFKVTVQAGVRVSDLEQVVEAARQTLAIPPPRRAYEGTIGGLIATNAAGSRRYRYGTPRDRLIGITAIRVDGTILRSDQFTPNVGGQDLVTLFAGSCGSLGLIAQATFRLEPLTEVFCGVWLPCADPEHAARLVGIVSDDQIAPTGIDLRWHAGGLFGLIVMIEGNRDDVQARAERLHGLAGRHCPPTIAHAGASRPGESGHGGLPASAMQEIRAGLPGLPADDGTLVRVLFPPAQLARSLSIIRAAAAGSGVAERIEGSAGAGVLDVEIPAGSRAPAVAQFVSALRSELGSPSQAAREAAAAPRAVVVYAPDEVRSLTDMHGPMPSLALVRAVKDEFDPEHRMAPGRLADAV